MAERDRYLATTDWLAEHLGDANLRVLESTVFLRPNEAGRPANGQWLSQSMEEGLTLTRRYERRLAGLNRVRAGQLRVVDAARLLGVGERQPYRLVRGYRRAIRPRGT